jgi:hypothetical protein
VDEEDSRDLYAEVTMDELKKASKRTRVGLDRWTIELFSGFFDLFNQDLLAVVEESWRVVRIHVPFNTTCISLISKIDDPHTYDDFKPISLCNCIYKIVENIIAQRLKVVL